MGSNGHPDPRRVNFGGLFTEDHKVICGRGGGGVKTWGRLQDQNGFSETKWFLIYFVFHNALLFF